MAARKKQAKRGLQAIKKKRVTKKKKVAKKPLKKAKTSTALVKVDEIKIKKRPGKKKGCAPSGGHPQPDLMFDDPRNVKKLQQCAANCMTIEQTAACLGITRPTFYKILDRRPHLRDLMERAKAATIDEVAHSLIKDAKRGMTTERIFLLKCHANWKEKTEVVHSGSVKHELELDVVKRIDTMTPEQRAARLEELKALRAMDTDVIDVEVD